MIRYVLAFLISVAYLCLCYHIAQAGQYDEALGKARDAALIQSGIKAQVDKTKRRLEELAKWKAVNLGVEKPLAAMLYCTKAYVDKAVILPLASNKHLRLGRDGIGLVINF